MSGPAASTQPRADGRSVGTSRLVLVVGEAADRFPQPEGETQGFYFATLSDLTAGLLRRLRPDVVLSPLITRSFDCTELAQRLCQLRFRGAYRVMAPPLPRPGVIRDEIAALCPELAFDLLIVEPRPGLAS